MSKNNESNRPTHVIWQVQGEGDKARWTQIGAAWMHKDQKGANLKFDAMPLTGRVVIREKSEQKDRDGQGGAQ
jgi:hypothetical protein